MTRVLSSCVAGKAQRETRAGLEQDGSTPQEPIVRCEHERACSSRPQLSIYKKSSEDSSYSYSTISNTGERRAQRPTTHPTHKVLLSGIATHLCLTLFSLPSFIPVVKFLKILATTATALLSTVY